VLLERGLALGDARGPGRLVAEARRARDAGPVTGAAGDIEYRLAVGRHRRGIPGRSAAGNRYGSGRDREAAVVRAGHGHLAERLDALVRGRLHQRVPGVPGALRATVHEAGNPDQDQCDGDEDADHRAENVDEMTIRLGHARIIASGRPDH
jgi:hypothetical protein